MRQGFQSLSDCRIVGMADRPRSHSRPRLSSASRSGLPTSPPGIEIPV
ncbi:hypothetical protein QUB41_15380 [Microcoleus sp. AT8-B2]